MAATKKSKKERAQEVLTSDDYLKKVLQYVPEAEQADLLERLGDHVLMRDDYSRLSDEATQAKTLAEQQKALSDKIYADNLKWKAENEAFLKNKLDELTKKEQALATTSNLAPDFDPSKFLTKEEAAKLTAEARRDVEAQSLALTDAIDSLRARHFKEFGEYLTQGELISHARKIGKPVDQAYEDLTRTRYEEKSKKATEDWKAAERAKIEKEIRSSLGAAAVYPVNNEPTTLAGIVVNKPGETAQANPKYGVAAAVNAMLSGEAKIPTAS